MKYEPVVAARPGRRHVHITPPLLTPHGTGFESHPQDHRYRYRLRGSSSTPNCEAILRAGGASLDDVVEVGVLLADPRDFDGMNEEYARWFAESRPARYAARLGAEIPGLLVSIRMTAVVG
ncbi:MAG: RidA family protein [Kineosporiaceae bacterium]